MIKITESEEKITPAKKNIKLDGNCDNEDFLEDLEEQDVCVEKTLVYHEGLAIAGAGGGTYFTGKTEFEREEQDIIADFNMSQSAER